MPSWVKDEDKWEKSKEIVKKQYNLSEKDEEDFWKLVTGVYKKMGGEIRSPKEGSVIINKVNINENRMFFDQKRADSIIQSKGYSSFDEYMKKEYDIPKSYYEIKADGDMNLWTEAFKKKTSKINRFMSDVQAQFKTNNALQYLRPDQDGFDYTPSTLAGPATTKPATGQKPSSPPPKSTKVISSIEVREALPFYFGDSGYSVGFYESEKEGRASVVIKGGDTEVYDTIDKETLLNLKGNDFWNTIYNDYIYINLNKVIRGLNDPITFKIRNYPFEAYLEESSVKSKGNLKYKVDILDTTLKGIVKQSSIEVVISDAVKDFKDITNKIIILTNKKLEEIGVFKEGKGGLVGVKSASKIKSIASNVSKVEKDILKVFSSLYPSLFNRSSAKDIFDKYMFRFKILVDSSKLLIGVEISIHFLSDSPISRKDLKAVTDKIDKDICSVLARSNGKIEKGESGISKDGLAYMNIRVYGEDLLSKLYSDLNLSESFGLSGYFKEEAVDIVEESIEYNHLLEYYNCPLIDSIDFEITDEGLESFITFSDDVSSDDLKDFLDSNENVIMMFDEVDGIYIAHECVSGIMSIEELVK